MNGTHGFDGRAGSVWWYIYFVEDRLLFSPSPAES